MKRNILAALLLLTPICAYADVQQGAPVNLRDGAGNETGVSSNPTRSLSGTAAPGACAATTVLTTPTLIVAAGNTRGGGGIHVPAGAAQGIYYSWVSATPGTTEGGTTFYLAPNATLSFAGAPNTALYAQAAASTAIACMTE